MVNPVQGITCDSLVRICVRAPNWVGDTVMATPALRALRQRFTGAHITVVARSSVAPVLRGAPWFDDVIVYEAKARPPYREFLQCAGRLRKGDYQLGLVLPNSFSSALMFRLGGVKQRIGYARDGRSFLLTDAVPRPMTNGRFRPTYMVDYYLALCERLGVDTVERETQLPFSATDRLRADDIMKARGLEPERLLFLMHPGGAYGPSKHWPPARFSRLAELLQSQHGAQVAIIGGPDSDVISQEIVRGSSARNANLVGSEIDLHLLKCVVARSSLLVSTDSGPRHYGVALNVPTVCVMGPTHPGYSTSSRPNDHVVRLDVDCGPCQRKVCPRDHRCMEGITAEMVFGACSQALSQCQEPEKR